MFLVEKDMEIRDSLVVGAPMIESGRTGERAGVLKNVKHGHGHTGLPTPSTSPADAVGMPLVAGGGMVRQYMEVYDYVGGSRFRGFTAEKRDGERAMFVFFDREVIGQDLKAGYVLATRYGALHFADLVLDLLLCWN